MNDHRGWLVDPLSDAPDVHVLPCEDGLPARGHEPTLMRPACRPEPIREGPLDSPVWSHVEPTWPGSDRGYVN